MPGEKKTTLNVPMRINPVTTTALVPAVDPRLEEEAKAMREAYDQMNDKLKAATQKIHALIVDIAKEGIKRMWKLGENVRKVKDNPETYGDDAMYLIDKALGKTSKSLIQKAVRLNTWVDEEQLDKMLAMRMKLTGKPITWNHYEKLLTVKDNDKRSEILKLTVDQELTPEEVQDLTLTARGEDKPHGGGRPVAVPATYTSKAIHYLKKLNAVLRDADAIYDHDENGFFEQAESMPADKITPDMIEKTQEMVETTRGVLDFTRQFVLRLEDTVTVLQKRMNIQASKVGASEAATISPAAPVIIDAEFTEKVETAV